MALQQMLEESQGKIYGIPEENFKEQFQIKPQIQLFFSEDSKTAPENRSPTLARYAIKLQNDIPESTWEASLTQLAKKIKAEFAPTHPTYTWQKGKNIYWYRDKEFGHNFRIYANTESEAEPLIKKMLAIQSQPFKIDCFGNSAPKRDSENNPGGTTLRFGKRRNKPRWRPNVAVRFRWAALLIPEFDGDKMLVDTTGRHHDALIHA
jgi:hypothetical protein